MEMEMELESDLIPKKMFTWSGNLNIFDYDSAHDELFEKSMPLLAKEAKVNSMFSREDLLLEQVNKANNNIFESSTMYSIDHEFLKTQRKLSKKNSLPYCFDASKIQTKDKPSTFMEAFKKKTASLSEQTTINLIFDSGSGSELPKNLSVSELIDSASSSDNPTQFGNRTMRSCNDVIICQRLIIPFINNYDTLKARVDESSEKKLYGFHSNILVNYLWQLTLITTYYTKYPEDYSKTELLKINNEDNNEKKGFKLALFFLRHIMFQIKKKKTLEYRFISSSDLYEVPEFMDGTLEQKIYVNTLRIFNAKLGKPLKDRVNYFPKSATKWDVFNVPRDFCWLRLKDITNYRTRNVKNKARSIVSSKRNENDSVGSFYIFKEMDSFIRANKIGPKTGDMMKLRLPQILKFSGDTSHLVNLKLEYRALHPLNDTPLPEIDTSSIESIERKNYYKTLCSSKAEHTYNFLQTDDRPLLSRSINLIQDNIGVIFKSNNFMKLTSSIDLKGDDNKNFHVVIKKQLTIAQLKDTIKTIDPNKEYYKEDLEKLNLSKLQSILEKVESQKAEANKQERIRLYEEQMKIKFNQKLRDALEMPLFKNLLSNSYDSGILTNALKESYLKRFFNTSRRFAPKIEKGIIANNPYSPSLILNVDYNNRSNEFIQKKMNEKFEVFNKTYKVSEHIEAIEYILPLLESSYNKELVNTLTLDGYNELSILELKEEIEKIKKIIMCYDVKINIDGDLKSDKGASYRNEFINNIIYVLESWLDYVESNNKRNLSGGTGEYRKRSGDGGNEAEERDPKRLRMKEPDNPDLVLVEKNSENLIKIDDYLDQFLDEKNLENLIKIDDSLLDFLKATTLLIMMNYSSKPQLGGALFTPSSGADEPSVAQTIINSVKSLFTPTESSKSASTGPLNNIAKKIIEILGVNPSKIVEELKSYYRKELIMEPACKEHEEGEEDDEDCDLRNNYIIYTINNLNSGIYDSATMNSVSKTDIYDIVNNVLLLKTPYYMVPIYRKVLLQWLNTLYSDYNFENYINVSDDLSYINNIVDIGPIKKQIITVYLDHDCNKSKNGGGKGFKHKRKTKKKKGCKSTKHKKKTSKRP